MNTIDLSQPAMPAPPGIVANFEHPPNHAALAYSTAITGIVLSTIFVWFRTAVKVFVVKKLFVEDYLMPLAWLAALGHYTPGLVAYSFAPLIHSWDMQLQTLGRYLLLFRIGAVFYNITMVLIKISMLLQIRRLFLPPGVRSKTYYLIHSLIWLNTLYYIAAMCSMIFICRPIQKAWTPWLSGKCYKTGDIAMATASLNVISDLVILFLAQRIIWKMMKVDHNKKLRLCIVFLASLVPCTFAGVCLYFNDRMGHSTDFVYDLAIMSIACYGEMTSAFFVLFLLIIPRFYIWAFGSSKASRPPSALDFADVGAPDSSGKQRKGKSVWHISYTQGGDDEEQGGAGWKEEKLQRPAEVRSISSLQDEDTDVRSISPIFSKECEAVWKVPQ